jgi:hypothetical protein
MVQADNHQLLWTEKPQGIGRGMIHKLEEYRFELPRFDCWDGSRPLCKGGASILHGMLDVILQSFKGCDPICDGYLGPLALSL